jgi:uncharacterized protein YnzC (UPF0291/DUF896 family)
MVREALDTVATIRMTEEERERRNRYQRDYMRKRRAKLKAANSPLQSVPEATAPMKPAKPTTQPKANPARPLRSQDLASYEDLSTHKAKMLQRVWRKEVSDYLLDRFTAPEWPLTGAGMRTSKMLCFYFYLGEKLNRIVEQEKPGQTEEFLLAVLLECLNRLTGNDPTPAPNMLADNHREPMVVLSSGINSIVGWLIRCTRYRRRARLELRLA